MKYFGQEGVRVDRDRQRRLASAQDAEQASEVIRMTVADHGMLELVGRPPQRAHVVRDHHLREAGVEEDVVAPVPVAQLDPVRDAVLRADRLAIGRHEVIQQPEALDALRRRQEHVDVVVDEDGDADVRDRVQHQRASSSNGSRSASRPRCRTRSR